MTILFFFTTRWSRPTGSPRETDHGLYGQRTFIIISALCLTKPVWQNFAPMFCFPLTEKSNTSSIQKVSHRLDSHFKNRIKWIHKLQWLIYSIVFSLWDEHILEEACSVHYCHKTSLYNYFWTEEVHDITYFLHP